MMKTFFVVFAAVLIGLVVYDYIPALPGQQATTA